MFSNKKNREYGGYRGVRVDSLTHFYGLREEGQQFCSGRPTRPTTPPPANAALLQKSAGGLRVRIACLKLMQ